MTIEEEEARLRDIYAKKAEAGELDYDEKPSPTGEKDLEVMVSAVS